MPCLTQSQYQAILARSKIIPKPTQGEPAQSESALHKQIMDYCDSQWPRWKYIRARMDKKSTIGVGIHDITVFMPTGKVLCLECKAKGGKASTDQRNWAAEMAMLGHTVHFVWCWEDFLNILKPHIQPPAQAANGGQGQD